jgi:hypothetical protein
VSCQDPNAALPRVTGWEYQFVGIFSTVYPQFIGGIQNYVDENAQIRQGPAIRYAQGCYQVTLRLVSMVFPAPVEVVWRNWTKLFVGAQYDAWCQDGGDITGTWEVGDEKQGVFSFPGCAICGIEAQGINFASERMQTWDIKVTKLSQAP